MRIDWFRVIVELEDVGISMRSQAVTAEVSLASIYNYKSGGSEPRWTSGQLLLDLYMEKIGKEPPLRVVSTAEPTYLGRINQSAQRLQTTSVTT